MNPLKQCFLELYRLQYSEENVAELFSILNTVIRYLEAQEPNPLKNKALHFVKLTQEKDFTDFNDRELKEDIEHNFTYTRYPQYFNRIILSSIY